MPETILTVLRDWLATANIDAVLLILGTLGLVFLFGARRLLRRRRSYPSKRHVRNVDRARSLFAELQGWRGDGVAARIIAYLRKIDPYVFEELVITALEAQGFEVKRNQRYSGDGGIDGRFFVDGDRFLIQAKRYSGLINAEHLLAFSEAIARENAEGGLFVHTGRTPPSAYRNLAFDPRIKLVSGKDLVSLMRARPLSLFPGKTGE